MIVTKTAKGTKVFVSFCEDCGCNEGGFFVQVYADDDFENELDYFVLDRKKFSKAKDPYTLAERLAAEYIRSITDY